jgi:hypothetical protein
MALMESPAIVIGVALARRFGAPATTPANEHVRSGWAELWRDAFFNGSVFLLVGSLLMAPSPAKAATRRCTLSQAIFVKGMFALFLLDMGLVAREQFDR